MSFFSSAARRLVPFCSAFIQIVQVFLRISAVFLLPNCNFLMQSAFAKSCIFRRTQSKSPHFLHVQKMLPARTVYLHSCPPDGCDLFHEICIFSGRWGNAIIHPSTTGKPLSNQCCVYSPCFFARIPLFLFSEMKTHGGGCAIVRPGCHVFFFCLFIHSCIFPAVFVYFLFFTLTFFRIFATIIPIYRGTTVCPFGHRVEKVKTWPFEPVG